MNTMNTMNKLRTQQKYSKKIMNNITISKFLTLYLTIKKKKIIEIANFRSIRIHSKNN